MEGPHGRIASAPPLAIAGQGAHKNIIMVVCIYLWHDERKFKEVA